MSIDWGALALVTVVAFAATIVIVSSYSLGLRLLAVGQGDEDGHREAGVATAGRPLPATLGGFACIAIGAVAVLYGIYLVIPLFH
jgi:hypothetical protein